MRLAKRLSLLAITLLVLAALQVSWPPWLRWGEAAPDLLLVGSTVLALLNGPLTGAAAGFTSAALLVGLSAEPPLALLFTRILLGWLTGRLRGGLAGENLLSHVAVAVMATIASQLLAAGLPLLFTPNGTGGSPAAGLDLRLLLQHALWAAVGYRLVIGWPVSLDDLSADAGR